MKSNMFMVIYLNKNKMSKYTRSYPKNIIFNWRHGKPFFSMELWILQTNNGNGFPRIFRHLAVGRDDKGDRRLLRAMSSTASSGFSVPARHGKTCLRGIHREVPAIAASKTGLVKTFSRRCSLRWPKTCVTEAAST